MNLFQVRSSQEIIFWATLITNTVFSPFSVVPQSQFFVIYFQVPFTINNKSLMTMSVARVMPEQSKARQLEGYWVSNNQSTAKVMPGQNKARQLVGYWVLNDRSTAKVMQGKIKFVNWLVTGY